MQELQAYATAIHEAGHAVVAEAVGFTVVSVTMDRGDGTPYCHYRAPALSLRTWRNLAVVVAGTVAEAQIIGTPLDPVEGRTPGGYIEEWLAEAVEMTAWIDMTPEEDDDGDIYYAARLALDLHGDPEAQLRDAVSVAGEVVTERWTDVEALAAKVLAEHEGGGGNEFGPTTQENARRWTQRARDEGKLRPSLGRGRLGERPEGSGGGPDS